MTPVLILASQSPQRRALLEAIGVSFSQIPADINEKTIRDPDYQLRAQKIAQAKAEKVAEQHPNACVLAADSFVVCQGEVLEKPTNLNEARQMLVKQSGQWIDEYTGICYLDPAQNVKVIETDWAKGLFRSLTSSEIERYVTHNPVSTWAGAYSPAYPAGMTLFAELKGSMSGFCYGLPMERVIPLLQRSGFLPT